MKQKNKIIREQLDKTLKQFVHLAAANRPIKGWIRAIRTALGMNMQQLADRIGVHKSRIPRIEQDEVAGNLTIKTLQKAAEGLDCVFLYGFVPRESLENTVHQQAYLKATKDFNKLMHTMDLEAQSIPDSQRQKLFEQMLNDHLNSPNLWKGQHS